MTEETHRNWDIATKVAAPIVTIVGLLVGIGQFTREQANIRQRELVLLARNDALEFKRRVWERQLNIYMDTARVVGEISVVADRPAKFTEAVDQFYTLFWGNMILLEDVGVRGLMIRFHLEVRDYLDGVSSVERLKVRAAKLIDALRASSNASWVELNTKEKTGG